MPIPWDRVPPILVEAPESAPQFRTLTVLNGGQNLASELSGRIVVVSPQSSNTLQQWELLWQHHTFVNRAVNGNAYQFLFNRGSGRVLSRAPIFGYTVPVLSSAKATNEGSAAAALQLWNLRRL